MSLLKPIRFILFHIGITDEEPNFVFSLCVFWIWIVICGVGFLQGNQDANNPKDCRVFSVNDVILSPMYALGCNMGKDRFDIKLN